MDSQDSDWHLSPASRRAAAAEPCDPDGRSRRSSGTATAPVGTPEILGVGPVQFRLIRYEAVQTNRVNVVPCFGGRHVGRVVTRQELLFRRFGNLPPGRRALLAVGWNPGASEGVLLRLATLPEARPILAERDLESFPRLLEVLLADAETATLRALAANPGVPWAIRRELAAVSDDPRVRSAVGRSLRTADDLEVDGELERVLRKLAADPAPEVRKSVLWNSWAPLGVIEALARDPQPAVRRALALHRYRPEFATAWRLLLADPEICAVRAPAVGNPGHPPVPGELADGLLLDPDTRIPALLNPLITMSDDVAEVLMADLHTDPEGFTCVLLAGHPGLSAVLVHRLSTHRSACTRAMIATRGDITEKQRSTVIASLPRPDEDADLAGLAGDPFYGLDALDVAARGLAAGSAHAGPACLGSAQPFLRRAAARSAPLTPEVLAALFDDADPDVACAAAFRHPDPPGEVLERLVLRNSGPRQSGRRLLRHPAFPAEAWARLAASDETWLRRAACRDPRLPADVVGRLARESEPAVRAAAAGHPNLPEQCIRICSQTRESSCRRAWADRRH